MFIRAASPADAFTIAHLMQTVWSDETPDPLHIARVLERGGRATLIAEEHGRALGFIDAFGTGFWELDLMAVAPEAQGRGIGKALVTVALEAGRAQGFEWARGLVAADNLPSQGVMRRLGLTAGAPHTLYVHPGVRGEGGSSGAPLTEVFTLRYHGAWLDAPCPPDAFAAAARTCAAQGWSVVGAVLPDDAHDTRATALAAGFSAVGAYRWWSKSLR